ncbi:MAG: hypothetical protein HOM11_10175 [Methylococcales bacterium]|jgi:hypothetical protein|nr:hypothetical protein [Methylococcales bacterium]
MTTLQTPYKLLLLFITFFLSSISHADSTPLSVYADGKYNNLVQILNCPSDRATYGQYRDYGYWKGGAWCGQTGKAGNWVYAYPNWYVFSKNIGQKASANGQYGNLKQVLTCPSDKGKYGSYNNYGYWKGGSWCGQQGASGNWVYVYPSWYVWQTRY